MQEINLNQNNFSETIEKDGLILVDFWAPWCGPCKMMGQIIEELADEISDCKIAKLNIDENQKIAEKYSVMSIPSFLMFKDGKIVDQVVGAVSKDTLVAMIKKHQRD